jgi:hypothetical protein
MASKFGGIAVDEKLTTGSKFGGVAVQEPIETPVAAAPTQRKVPDLLPSGYFDKSDTTPGKAFMKSAVEAVPSAAGAYGGMEAGALLGSTLGPVGSFLGGLGGAFAGGYYGGKGGEKVGEAIPPSVKQATGFTKEEREKERKQYPVSSTLGTIAPDVAAVAPGVVKAGKYVAGLVKSPEPIAAVKDLSEVGQKGFNLLKDKAARLYEARSAEATTKYDNAFNAARQAQAKGEPFATSQQGRSLIAELENDKRIIAGGQEFEKGSEKVAGIDRLIKAIKGTTTGGETVSVGKGLISSNLTKKTPTKTTEKDIEALVEELRFLRDVDAKGKPYEAYSALSADYKRKLIDKLEKQLYEWAPDYRAADEAYKVASAKLDPFKTQLMSNALKGEKFNAKDLVKSPEDFGQIFFSDVNAVRNLKQATESPAEVARLAKEYVSSVFANKSPQQVQEFVKNTKNTGWLKEAGIYDDVINYANKSTTSQNRQEILKQLGKGAAYTAGALTLGGPVYYGIRRGLGF